MTHVVVAQAASVPFDSAATVAKAEGLIADCAARGAELAVFPEAFVGCYPKGAGFGAVVGRRTGPGRDLYRRYFDSAVRLDGPEVALLTRASAGHGIFVVIGVIERLGSTLYCTVLMIDPVAGLAGIHRKLMPTGTERLIWGFGDGSTIGAVESRAGRVGAVICWENYMPAFRQAMYAQGVELYCTALMIDPVLGLAGIHRKLMPTGTERLIWGFGDGSTIGTVESPAGRVGTVICWENYMPALRQAMYAQGVELYCAPTADDRPTWIPSMTHIALEGRVFVLTACQAIRVGDYPDWYQQELGEDPGSYLMRGGSAIIAPDGSVLAGPLFDTEGILDAEIDLADITRGHLDMDAVGHYSRPDVFELRVNTRSQSPVVFEDGGSTPTALVGSAKDSD